MPPIRNGPWLVGAGWSTLAALSCKTCSHLLPGGLHQVCTRRSPPPLPAQEEFLENLHKAAGALQAVVPQVIEFIAGKRYSDL